MMQIYILQNAIEKAVDMRYDLLNIKEYMQIDVFCSFFVVVVTVECCCSCCSSVIVDQQLQLNKNNNNIAQ